MRIKNYSELRNNLAKTMDEVVNDHNPIVITRGSKTPVIMMSLENYNSFEETIYLLKSPKNRKRLLSSLENIKKGHIKKRKLISE
jgi:antitoxin YefM